MKTPFLLLSVVGTALAGSAAAGDFAGYGRDDYRSADTEYARVVDVDPITTEVRISEPRRECFTDTRYVAVDRGVRADDGSRVVLGGIIGAVLGHQIGRGRDRGVTTVAGALIGSAIAHDAARGARDDYREAEVRPVTAERCETRFHDRYEQRIDGYRVTYRYHDRLYTTRMDYDPGDRLPITVRVEPRR